LLPPRFGCRMQGFKIRVYIAGGMVLGCSVHVGGWKLQVVGAGFGVHVAVLGLKGVHISFRVQGAEFWVQ
jgi:hypothetical protein